VITAEIAGYTFNIDNYCPECVHIWAVVNLENESYRPDRPLTQWATEELLNVLAALWDVDREYADPEDFPVPFSYAQAESARDRSTHYGDPLPMCAGSNCGNDFLGEF
jgi:hypothetical protein